MWFGRQVCFLAQSPRTSRNRAAELGKHSARWGGHTTRSSNGVNSRSGFVSLIRHDHVLAAVQKVPDSSQVSWPKGRAQNSFFCLKNQANGAQIRTKGAEGRQSSNSTKAKGKSFSTLVSFPLCFQKTQLHPPPDEIKSILRLATSLSR